MRITILIVLVLFLVIGCQWNQGSQSTHTQNRLAGSRSPEALAPSAHAATTPDSSGSTRASFTEAEFASHVAQLKKKLPSPHFSIVVQPPFVVVGDEPKEEVQRRAEGTVKWAVDRLKQDFFTKDPEAIIDIWLFKDDASYRKHARLIFGDEPTTPY